LAMRLQARGLPRIFNPTVQAHHTRVDVRGERRRDLQYLYGVAQMAGKRLLRREGWH